MHLYLGRSWFRLPAIVVFALCCCRSQAQQSLFDAGLSLSTTAVEPVRFVAAHGRQALVMGYGAPGLEIWAYPLQLVRNYRVRFLVPGTAEALDGVSFLRRIEYRPDEIVRIYVGPGFVVREHLFVPLDEPAAILTYEVEGRAAPAIRISFLPVMNLMWPGALGGQEVRWSGPLSGFLLSEQSEHFSALVASPDMVAHSEVVNSTLRTDLTQSLVLRPKTGQIAAPGAGSGSARQARLYISLNAKDATDGRATLARLAQQTESLGNAARTHYADLLNRTLRIHTPDEQVNRALAWSAIALDQAWVCNTQLGCGIVAGYGPSRGERRPQYAWFFAGDGLIATEALVATGEYERARDELAFILKYQNQANGMIWHELSQSAGFLDWAGKYPYMFVHVDITFAFLSTMEHYLAASGDAAFITANWPRIAAAYRYCQSVIDPATGLPTIPADKEGGDEQTRMRDDLGLSSSWLAPRTPLPPGTGIRRPGSGSRGTQLQVCPSRTGEAVRRRFCRSTSSRPRNKTRSCHGSRHPISRPTGARAACPLLRLASTPIPTHAAAFPRSVQPTLQQHSGPPIALSLPGRCGARCCPGSISTRSATCMK